MNNYELTRSNPIVNVDPFGLFCCNILLGDVINEYFKALGEKVGLDPAGKGPLGLGIIPAVLEQFDKAKQWLKDAFSKVLPDNLKAKAGDISAVLAKLIQDQTKAEVCVSGRDVTDEMARPCCCKITADPKTPRLKGGSIEGAGVSVSIDYRDTKITECCKPFVGSKSDFGLVRVVININVEGAGIKATYPIEASQKYLIPCQETTFNKVIPKKEGELFEPPPKPPITLKDEAECLRVNSASCADFP